MIVHRSIHTPKPGKGGPFQDREAAETESFLLEEA